MKRLATLCLFFILLLMAPAVFAQDYSYLDDEEEDHWMFSLSPGYGLLYVSGEEDIRHGFGSSIEGNYEVAPGWRVGLKAKLGIYDGDKDQDQGIYTQVALLGGARYTFLRDWVQPYVFVDLGWVRTELDRETDTILTSHSMQIEGGLGVSFRILKSFYLGLEAAVGPQLFGHDDIHGSFYFHGLLCFELRV